MWKFTLVLLAVAFSTVQGYRLGVASWDQLITELVQRQQQGVETGTCGDRCFVAVDGGTHVLEQYEQYSAGSNPCLLYTCTNSGVTQEEITCSDVTCNNGPPIIYPGRCCRECVGGPSEPGEFEIWGEWTECSATCGGGRRARERICKINDNAVYVECTGDLLDIENCNTQPCPVGCVWEWGNYGECSTTCGEGIKARFPIIMQHPQHGGMPCPPNVESEVPDEAPCNLGPCEVPCEWDYGSFGQCSVTCGGGTKSRFPIIIRPAQHGGYCPVHVLNEIPDTVSCNSNPCPVPCEWGWGNYGECSTTCGDGIKTRFPIITQHPQHGAEPCPLNVENGVADRASCNIAPCPVPCEWEYGSFGQCSVTCGGGTKSRFPIIIRPAQHGGDCPEHVLNETPDTVSCNSNPCPVPCEWEWGEYGVCSKTCGSGTKQRFPIITTFAEHGGFCPANVINNIPETSSCNTNPCPIPCQWEWSDFEECDVTCGGGVQSRHPIITVPAQHGGTCPESVLNGDLETRGCNPEECPLTCGPGEHACKIRKVFKCIPDIDGDCIRDNEDNCIYVHNPTQEDQEFDGVGDRCDNCPKFPNPLQGNADGDETGDACDADDDNDGILDPDDNCIFDANSDQIDSDGDGVGDVCDNCVSRKNKSQRDDDNDGIGNSCDNCRDVYNPNQLDSDCTVKSMAFDEDDNNVITESEKNSLAAQIMEKLLEMYYSN